MTSIGFHPAADAEVVEAARFYEERCGGLGLTFLRELHAALEIVVAHPEACERAGHEVRRKVLRRFPYSILYTAEHRRIWVVAVAHHKRKPGYWHTRVQEHIAKYAGSR